jgi:molybdopterin/thiamine biosynthesis adenylyltransferase/rhodanese-related sulfurtransferase/molybdopterin converting factor small subunit
MATKVMIPTPLRAYTEKREAVFAEGRTVGEVLEHLAATYAPLRRHLFTEEGKLRAFVNVYVNDEDIRYLNKEHTAVTENDVVSIIPAIAGGAEPTDVQVRSDVKLSPEEFRRYGRHLIMPEVGLDGQKKLKAASVLIIGAGGLGSPLALYLAAAGVGRIGIVDFDVVEHSNLQRQIIHSTSNIGRPKLISAKERIGEVNPHVQVDLYETRLTSENALEILARYDVVVDGTDNFPTRYLVNDACVLLHKPNVYGSIFRFEGQASVFSADEGPCYRCLYAEPPPPGLVPSCAEGGVLGVLPGIIGTIQATETIKLIIGIGKPLIGRLLLFDALTMQFRELKLRKNPDCPICGEHPRITELIDYEAFCGVAPTDGAQQREFEITVDELKAKLDRGEEVFVLDVREPHEYAIVHMNGYLIPLNDLPRRVNELDSAREIVVHCHHGTRSARAVEFLRQLGFRKVKNLVGGIDAWAERVDPRLTRY